MAEEERDTCPSCGMLKAWCRDPDHQFAFEPHEETCWPTYRLASWRAATGEGTFGSYDDATKQALQVSARFREGREPDLMAGLDLPDED